MRKLSAVLMLIILPSLVIGTIGCSESEPSPTATPKATATPAVVQDSDGDGWTDAQEQAAGTDPHRVDTDGDGYWDPQDPNPLDPRIPVRASTPTPTPTMTPTPTVTPTTPPYVPPPYVPPATPTPAPTPTPTPTLQRDPQGHPEMMPLYVTPYDPEVQSVVNDIRNRGLKVFTDFEALRDWVAWHISYRSDQDVHGEDEYWQLPVETLQLGTGDCEDFAILLCSLLRAYGVPSDQVYVALGYPDNGARGHAYLVEKWYEGIWRVIEPLHTTLVGIFMADWSTSVSFETVYCFSDQYYFEGPPTLPPGVYEFELSFLGGASATFERYMDSGQSITGSVEWLGKCGQEPEEFFVFGWGLRIYASDGHTVFAWFGGDLQHNFSFTPLVSGKYKVEVYLGGASLGRYARLTINPPDWSQK